MKKLFVLKFGDYEEAMVMAANLAEAKELVFEKGAFGLKVSEGLFKYDPEELVAVFMEDEDYED